MHTCILNIIYFCYMKAEIFFNSVGWQLVFPTKSKGPYLFLLWISRYEKLSNERVMFKVHIGYVYGCKVFKIDIKNLPLNKMYDLVRFINSEK
jgi:hypothetical protein